MSKVLVVNPGSTSTKISLYDEGQRIFEDTIEHNKEIISKFSSVASQLSYRYDLIVKWLEEKNVLINDLVAVSARGGMLRPLEGGTYKISENMVEELLSSKYGEHASNLGAAIALELQKKNPSLICTITNPTCVDELCEYARMTGCLELPNISKFHALSQKNIACKVAKSQGKRYEDTNIIVAHMGGGITVGVHQKGKVVHVNNGLDGAGPFSPERAGTLPRFQLIEMCYSGKYTEKELKTLLGSNSGIMGYLGTNDLKVVEKNALDGDAEAAKYLQGMCYGIGREIAAGAAVLKGQCDAIVLTGGIAYSSYVTNAISEMVSFIAPITIMPGSDENQALADASYDVVNGIIELKEY